jgi:hypothetical protein
MGSMAAIIHFGAVVICGLLACLVAFRLLTGEINTEGLLRDKSTGGLSPGRVQLLASTVAIVASLLLRIDEMVVHNRIILPSWTPVLAYGGSQFVYLVGKYRSKRRASA